MTVPASVWLLNEDDAMKTKFKGLTVTDANAPTGGRPVLVRYADPEVEFGALSYPAIIVTRMSLSPAHDREHRGNGWVSYWPEGTANEDNSRLDPSKAPKVEIPVPMDLVYQITVMTRNANHQMQLVTALAGHDYLPLRFGYLSVPQDASTRSLFLDGGPEFESGLDGDGKRLLQVHYNVRIATELPPSTVQAVAAATISLTVAPK